MTIIKAQSFSGIQPAFKEGDEIVGCNLAQDVPHTKIAAGVKGLTFVACNLLNCDLPSDAVVKDCFHAHILTTVVQPVPILDRRGTPIDRAGVDALMAEYQGMIDLYQQKIKDLQPTTRRDVVE